MSRRPPEPWGAAMLHDRPARARCGDARTAERLDPWRAGGGEAASAPAARAGVTASATRVGLCPSWRATAPAQARALPPAGAVARAPEGDWWRGDAVVAAWWRRGRVMERRAGWTRWQLSVSCVCGGWLSERHKCAGKDTLPCAEIWGTRQRCNVCRVSWFRAHGKLHLYRVPQAQHTANICFFQNINNIDFKSCFTKFNRINTENTLPKTLNNLFYDCKRKNPLFHLVINQFKCISHDMG